MRALAVVPPAPAAPALALLSLLVTVPGPAAAHAALAGLGPLPAGALHPVVVPGQMLALLALGLWLGQHGAGPMARALVAFAVVVAAGLAWSLTSNLGLASERPLLLLGLLLALATAWARPLPRRIGGAALVVAAVLVAFGVAVDSLPEVSAPIAARWRQVVGTAISSTALVILAAALAAAAARARASWPRIGVRVLASWLAAAALLVTALGFVSTP